jgi:hypothetical protein
MKKQNKNMTINGSFAPFWRLMLAAGSSTKSVLGALAIFAAAGLTTSAGQFGTDNRAPDVPQEIKVEEGNRVHFHGFAIGFQVYTWTGTAWSAAVPDATLFDNDGNVVATHFAGPRWKSNSGSIVLAAVDAPRITVNRDSIEWLRLKTVSTEGSGIFADTTFVQRVNTFGGLPPASNGNAIGDVFKSPYTADYFFYRATGPQAD